MRSKFLTLIIFLQTLNLLAQQTTNSPFSSYGFGERNFGTDPVTSALGQARLTYMDSTMVNTNNPASYNTLATGQPLFSIGLRGRVSNMTQDGNTTSSVLGTVDHFTLAFTLKKHFGLAFGLKPYSRRGYEITERTRVGSDSMRYQYIGSGGANQVFVGLSTTVFKWKETHLSLGSNVGYLFGSATNERRSNIVSSGLPYGGVDQKSIRFRSFHYELGAYLRQNIGEKQNIILSAWMEPQQQLKAFRDETLYIASDVDNPASYGKLYDTTGVEGIVSLAPSFALGLNYSYRFETLNSKGRKRTSELQVHGMWSSTDWSKFRTEFGSNTESLNVNSTSIIAVGLQYTPETKFLENAVTTNFMERLKYRAGFYTTSYPFTENGKGITEIGTTFGFGMPITAQQALSSINLGVTLGKRGNGEASGLNENFIGINFGLIVAPSNYDRWFRKRKLD